MLLSRSIVINEATLLPLSCIGPLLSCMSVGGKFVYVPEILPACLYLGLTLWPLVLPKTSCLVLGFA